MRRFVRSLLFIPSDNPGMLFSGPVFPCDGLIFDLEDAVSVGEKDAARILLGSALRSLDYGDKEIVVRINGLESPYWLDDLREVIPRCPSAVLLPKTRSRDDVERLSAELSGLEGEFGLAPGVVSIVPLVESALGLENAFEIAKAGPRVSGLLLGAEDLTASLEARRTKNGEEILYARSRIVAAAKAAGVRAIDTPFTDVNDEEGLAEDCALARRLGFNGKAVISPRHVEAVNAAFSPGEDEIRWARRVMTAVERAEADGRGAVSLDGRMIDAPIAARARQVLAMAELVREGAAR